MYAYIKGVVTDRNDQQIVIENKGIGYLINCPLGISAEIGESAMRLRFIFTRA